MALLHRNGAQRPRRPTRLNLFDRAVTLLPRIDQLWYKYVYLKEHLSNVAGARGGVFE
jgi:hypothetical protein